METPLPRAIRWASALAGVCAVVTGTMAAVAFSCLSRVISVADAYRALPPDPEVLAAMNTIVRGLESTVGYSLVVTAVTAVGAAVLTFALRRPWPWARVAMWWFAGLGAVLLLIDVTTDPVESSGQGPSDSPIYDLSDLAAPQAGFGPHPLSEWYSYLNAGLGLIALVTLVAAAIQLSRASALDHYRPASRVADPRWAAFVQKRKDNQERGV